MTTQVDDIYFFKGKRYLLVHQELLDPPNFCGIIKGFDRSTMSTGNRRGYYSEYEISGWLTITQLSVSIVNDAIPQFIERHSWIKRGNPTVAVDEMNYCNIRMSHSIATTGLIIIERIEAFFDQYEVTLPKGDYTESCEWAIAAFILDKGRVVKQKDLTPIVQRFGASCTRYPLGSW